MKKLPILLFCFVVCGGAMAQEFAYRAGLHSFFNNTEYGGSPVQMPQTMAGVHLAPQAGIRWDSAHSVFAGIDAMHEWGSSSAIDYYDPIAYYRFSGNPFRLLVGAFPRQMALEAYPRMFFTDSILNYRPIVNGIFWECRKDGNYLNAWLDWASRQAVRRHEAFFMGWSARCNFAWLYAQHFGYMFHFAGTIDPVAADGSLHDNGMTLTQAGADLKGMTFFDILDINVGYSCGMERDRGIGEWHYPAGFLSEVKVEWRGVGLFNTYYRGAAQQVFYGEPYNQPNQIYWGDRFYRTKEYDRLDLYVKFFNNKWLNVKLLYSFHFSGGAMYHEQSFYASVDISSIAAPSKAKQRYLWDRWFDGAAPAQP